jgi:hypothetical protein
MGAKLKGDHMNAYTRCEKHNLMRCAMCSRPEVFQAPQIPQQALTPSAKTPGFDPSDMLDVPASGKSVDETGAAVLDAETQAAIERNREIANAQKQPPSDGSINDPTVIHSIVGDLTPHRVPKTQSANPIVVAAEDYARSQREVELTKGKVGFLEHELEIAMKDADEALQNCEAAKAALQKLVAS